MTVDAFLRRLVVVRHDLQRRVCADFLRLARELDGFGRFLPPEPAITGIRPAVCSTAVLTISTCSSTESVADSPLVPTTTSAFMPLGDMPVDPVAKRRQVEAAVFEPSG